MEKAVIKISGMSCGHCEAAVEGALENLEGVKKAKADSKSGTATVKYDPEKVSVEKMKKSVAAVGYDTE